MPSFRIGMPAKMVSKKSRYLSMLLRHKPEQANLTMEDGGWIDVPSLVENAKFPMHLLEFIVATDDKGRYEFKKDKTKIRARQGHPVNVDLKLEEREPPAILYHGTATRFLDSIWRDGLMPMGRHHVHLSADVDTATKVGARHGKAVVLIVKAKEMIDEMGVKFYISNNGVWLVDAVPPGYLKES